MGYILKLPTAGSASLPTLGDIGYISKVGLKGLYLIDGGDGLAEASGAAAGLSLLTGTTVPPYSGGVLQFRAAAAGTGQHLSTGSTIAGPEQTIIMAAKKVANPAVGMIGWSHVGGILASNASSPMTLYFPSDGATGTQSQNWGQQAKRPTTTAGGNGLNQWQMWAGRRDATKMSLSIDGQASVSVNYDTPDPGINTTAAVTFGDNTNVRRLDADVGFIAVYARALPDGEISAVYKAVKRLMASKGITM